ncbi:MAG: hypothetical protein ABIS44_08595 [Mycobacteriales bacterium]
MDRSTDDEPASEEVPDANSYAELVEIARAHGPEEIKHLTRAYQAIAPDGGGRMIDLTALLDKATPKK